MSMTNRFVPVLGIVAPSGTGKTTLLLKVLPLLRERGLRVGYLKHSHHELKLDEPGKDSFEVAASGAEQVILAAADGWALMDYAPGQDGARELPLAALLARFDATRLDLVLVEGFREAHYPKLEVHRAAAGKPPRFPDDPDIIAVVSDAALPRTAAPDLLSIDDPAAVADYIQARLADGQLTAEDPREELLRRCRECRISPAEPRAGWLSVRVGERCWLAPIALAGDDPTPASIQAYAVTAAEEQAPAVADGEAVDLTALEARIHRGIYAAQPSARAVVGARMPYTAAVGFRGRSFEPVDPDGAAALGALPALSFGLEELVAKAPDAIAEQLIEGSACIVAGQGAYTWGGDLAEALQRAALLERSAEIYALWRQASV
jgi:molybdopterin-guanine dinucleotide biosynthesis protein B